MPRDSWQQDGVAGLPLLYLQRNVDCHFYQVPEDQKQRPCRRNSRADYHSGSSCQSLVSFGLPAADSGILQFAEAEAAHDERTAVGNGISDRRSHCVGTVDSLSV